MTATMAPTPARDVPTRRIRFEYSLDDMPKHFANGDVVMSHVVAVLSSMFPDGEDFFVRSVRNFRDDITDPELKKQVSGFIGQEAIHGREHRDFNEKLAELGYPTKKIERFVDRGLRFREKTQTKRASLAVTAALEHYTATLAETLLTSEDARNQLGDGEVKSLFLWHALEESEHKSVAFDVYRAVGGREWVRKAFMNLITVGFMLGVVLTTAITIAGDRDGRKLSKLIPSLKRLKHSPFLTRDMWNRLRDYNRSEFHPDDHDTADLIEQWRDELFGADGRLKEKLK